jgi:hypothetical protein
MNMLTRAWNRVWEWLTACMWALLPLERKEEVHSMPPTEPIARSE